ncbi:MAG: nucleotidyltransferase domain-containing protein [Bacteroidota bacterium]
MSRQSLSEAVGPEVQRAIRARLRAIEREERVWIVYAVESGSRAWGFASADSDYDVRFLYVRPRDWYLTIDAERKRDVIERPISDDLDLSGWDLRKALGLFRKSNPPLLEWLQSPLVYVEDGPVAEQMRALLPTHYAPRACFYHYLSMARNNARSYLRGETVQHKKYFYVLRPLLACRWIAEARGPVPMEFEVLVRAMLDDAAVTEEIVDLIAQKRVGLEAERGPRLPAIHAFVEAELEKLGKEADGLRTPETVLGPLNQLFRSTLDAFDQR